MWIPPGRATGVLVDYRPARCLLPGASRNASEGPSPLMFRSSIVGTGLTGLTPGQVYEVGVRGYTAAGQVGPRISGRVMHIDPADAGGNGIPDQWETIYGLVRDTTDLDGDGLSDLNEYNAGANPRRADSDGDGVYDAAEVEAGTDPCDPADRPRNAAPRLALTGDAALRFAGAANLAAPPPQFVSMWNTEGGALAWQAAASAPWIRLSPASGSGAGAFAIAIEPAGMAPGRYTGAITVTNTTARASAQSAMAAQAEEASIPVTMLVLPPKASQLYLPLVSR